MPNQRRSRKKRSNLQPLLLAIGFLFLLGAGAYLLIQWWYGRGSYIERPAIIRYKNFGIHIPPGFAVHGIDVSNHQGSINWPLVGAMQDDGISLDFVIIKATEGVSHTDRKFERNWRGAKEAGMARGAYHFLTPSISGKEQARHFISQVKLRPGDLPPVLDVETIGFVSKERLKSRVREFLETVEKHYKIKPIIYSNAKFYDHILGPEFNNYPLWVAHYFRLNSPRIGRNWTFWQHSERGRVNGIRGAVDFNVFEGDSLALRKLLVRPPR
jgi:lysozyme